MKIDDSATVWLGEAPGSGTPLLLIMHGFGANERDLAPLVEYFPGSFSAACIRAPLPIPQFPGGYAWFPITANAGMPDLSAADGAAAAVINWIEDLRSRVEVGPIVLLGFSQGGAMVTHLLRHQPEEFAAGLVLSGFIVPGQVESDATLAKRKPPVFFGYDPHDPIVPESAFLLTRAFGEEHFTQDVRTYTMGHGINQEELSDIAAFLAGVLS